MSVGTALPRSRRPEPVNGGPQAVGKSRLRDIRKQLSQYRRICLRLSNITNSTGLELNRKFPSKYRLEFFNDLQKRYAQAERQVDRLEVADTAVDCINNHSHDRVDIGEIATLCTIAMNR